MSDWFCSNCDAQVDINKTFCANCGVRLFPESQEYGEPVPRTISKNSRRHRKSSAKPRKRIALMLSVLIIAMATVVIYFIFVDRLTPLEKYAVTAVREIQKGLVAPQSIQLHEVLVNLGDSSDKNADSEMPNTQARVLVGYTAMNLSGGFTPSQAGVYLYDKPDSDGNLAKVNNKYSDFVISLETDRRLQNKMNIENIGYTIMVLSGFYQEVDSSKVQAALKK